MHKYLDFDNWTHWCERCGVMKYLAEVAPGVYEPEYYTPGNPQTDKEKEPECKLVKAGKAKSLR
jgi:hypothetical protein